MVITKEGYNGFQNTYDVASDIKVKVTLLPSQGSFFFDLNIANENPFYDPNGLYGVMPPWVLALSGLSTMGRVFLFTRKE